ncbi:MAG: redoxin family protein [Acidimicrobiia bacterium]
MTETHPARQTILDTRRARERRRRRRWVAAALLLATLPAGLSVLRDVPSERFAVDPDNLPRLGPVPELHPTGWVNGEPLANEALAGKVVLYDFWTYSCVNCLRTIPHLRAWHERYQGDGLLIVGVHSPEFGFERDAANVKAAVERLGVDWPVALDAEGNIWDAFSNRQWPALYVADREGQLRYRHFGEGEYDQTESVLRNLLGVGDSAARAVDPGATSPGSDPGDITGETPLGTARSDVADPGRHRYRGGDDRPPPGDVSLEGVWEGGRDQLRALEAEASLTLGYRAAEVNLVMATAGDPVDVIAELDGNPLPEDYRSTRTLVDGQGRTYVRVAEPGLYRLLRGPRVERGVLRLVPQAPGLEAYAFTFG